MSLENRPCMVMASPDGNIFDEPDFFMVARKGDELALPKPDELIPLPENSELFLLPGRNAIGLDPESGELIEHDGLAVAAFAPPGYTLTAHPAYSKTKDAPALPLFAYGAVGFYKNRFYICSKHIDKDERHNFKGISSKSIGQKGLALAKKFPDNRLIQHIVYNCALKYGCANAKNFCLGRFEISLPTFKNGNTHCVGDLSQERKDSNICRYSQDLLTFTPTAQELFETMWEHSEKAEKAIFSFGQGCEEEPFIEKDLIAEAIRLFRKKSKKGCINLNSNASRPKAVKELAEAGLDSISISLNSASNESYTRYYQPQGYQLENLMESIDIAKEFGLFVSLDFSFFPAFSDTELETSALEKLIADKKIDCLQLKNLKTDPDIYLELMQGIERGPYIGFTNFLKRVKNAKPDMQVLYFNPYLE